MLPDLERLTHKVNAHDESLRAISDTVVGMKVVVDQHTGQLTAIQRTLGRHDTRFGNIEQRLDRLDQRFDGVGQRLEGVDQRLDGMRDMLVEVLRRLPDVAAG